MHTIGSFVIIGNNTFFGFFSTIQNIQPCRNDLVFINTLNDWYMAVA